MNQEFNTLPSMTDEELDVVSGAGFGDAVLDLVANTTAGALGGLLLAGPAGYIVGGTLGLARGAYRGYQEINR